MWHCRGVIGSKHIKKPNFPKLFSKGFRIARHFYFPKNHDFYDELYSVISNIVYFRFQKCTFRNKDRHENDFHVFVFSLNAFEKHRFDDEKKWKNHVFHVFSHFFVTHKLLPGHLVLGAKTDFWAYIGRHQKQRKHKNLQKSFFQSRVERCRKS